MNLPNKITVCRIALIPIFVALYYLTIIPYNFLWATIVFAIAAFTDFLDGYIARKYKLVTDLGKFLDPIADKVLVLTALILMLTGVGGGILDSLTGGIGVAIILARELIVSSFRMVAATKKLVIAADKLGKIKTVSQDISIVLLMFAKAFSGTLFTVIYWIGYGLFVFSVVMTVISGINYVYRNRAVLKEEN
ncbi:MAG: CDP-diacylglycerol--glycerol-3-phosphate 3-phosphatidyltransferase [Clostridia bacterium]|nr:CDP-diacylglycerol--glycerol-3-phosphate 3-phosphatidyltransferase [Clostridia bacterium]